MTQPQNDNNHLFHFKTPLSCGVFYCRDERAPSENGDKEAEAAVEVGGGRGGKRCLMG